MKVYYSIFCILIFHLFSFGQKNEKGSILILSVNFHTTTIISIPCENFATVFNTQIKTNEIFNKDSIIMLDDLIKSIKFSMSKKEINIDTRAKLIYKNDFGEDFIICLDNFNVSVNGSVVESNKTFFRFVQSLIPKEQLMKHPSSL